MYIEQVNSPQDIKQFSAEQLRQLAGEVRNALLTKLSAHVNYRMFCTVFYIMHSKSVTHISALCGKIHGISVFMYI